MVFYFLHLFVFFFQQKEQKLLDFVARVESMQLLRYRRTLKYTMIASAH